MVQKYDIIKKYAEEAVQNFGAKEVYLFGSYAKGTQEWDSDIDICLFFDDETAEDVVNNAQLKLIGLGARKYDEDFQPVVFRISDLYDDNPFVKEILRTGLKIA